MAVIQVPAVAPVSTTSGGVDILALLERGIQILDKFQGIMGQVKNMRNDGTQSQIPIRASGDPLPIASPVGIERAPLEHNHPPATCDILLKKLMDSLIFARTNGMGDIKLIDLLKMKNITIESITINQIYDLLLKL